MPPGFAPHTPNGAAALRDLNALDALLPKQSDLSESDDVLSFFKGHPHLTAFLGSYDTNMARFDLLAYEFLLGGQYRPDVIVGDWSRKRYILVEFENARADSVFRFTGRHTDDWADRFLRGYSQLIDWLCLLDGQQHTPQQEDRFGARSISVSGLLVIGRDTHIAASGQRRRFEWWREHVVVDSHPITCLTYDELARDLRDRLLVARASRARLRPRRPRLRDARALPAPDQQ